MTDRLDIPLDIRIWDARDCGEYLRQSHTHFLQVTRYAKGFPPQLGISEKGRPKWSAKAVIKWAMGE